MLQIEGVHSAKELIAELKTEIIKEMESKGYFNMAKIQSERQKALRKNWLKVSDIYQGQVWGAIGKDQIVNIIKTLPASEYRQSGKKNTYEVRRSAVIIVMEDRGIVE